MFIFHAIEDKTLIENPLSSIKIPSHKKLLIDRRSKTEIRIFSKILELHTELSDWLAIHRLPFNVSLTKHFTTIGQIRTEKKFFFLTDFVQDAN